jgi:glycerate 2-kinase
MCSKTLHKMRMEAKDLFMSGVQAVNAYDTTRQSLCINEETFTVRDTLSRYIPFNLKEFRHIFLTAFGKAAGLMARATEDILQDRITTGVVVVKHGNRIKLNRSHLLEAAHPLPDKHSLRGAQRIARLVSEAGETDLVLCLLSGGGSALCTLPDGNITLGDLRMVTRQLLSCGANIHEVNTLRKHVSQIKGGGLARLAYPATAVSLIISDVIADRLDSIASGPTAPDETTFQDAYDIMKKHGLLETVPVAIRNHIEAGLKGEVPETPKPGDPVFEKTNNIIITHNLDALRAIAQKAVQIGYRTLMLTSRVQGDTRNVARIFGTMIKDLSDSARSQGPICIIAGGEMTTRVTGKGKGGRNCDFGLALSPLIHGLKNTVVLSAGTDGADGPTDAAGVIIDGTTLHRLQSMGLDHNAALADHDSYSILKKSGDLLVTGPTGTNVMDLQLVLLGQ